MMIWYANLPYMSVFLCMFAAILLSVTKKAESAYRATVVVAGLCFAFSLIFLISISADHTVISYTMGKFPAPFGNEIRFGPLQGIFSSCFSGVMLMALLGGKTDLFADILPEKLNLYCVMINMTLASLMVLTYTNDVFTGYVFIEISTIAACALVMAKDRGATLMATTRYLFMSLLGSGLFLMSLVILYALTGHLLMPQLSEAVAALFESGEYRLPLYIAVGLMMAGLGIKSAMFPFHRWLPDAHGSATTTSSAVLSGLVLKGYIVLIITMIVRVFTIGFFRATGVWNILFVFGLAGMVLGSLYAIFESHIKRMLAYSSVAQIGYIFMGLGCTTTLGIAAAAFHILVHACCKPLLFICAGRLSGTVHHKKDLMELRGTAWNSPLAGFGFVVGGLSMIGIPLFAGFTSKLNFAASGDPGSIQMLLTLVGLALSSVLNALYYIPAIIVIWSAKPEVPGNLQESRKQEKYGHDIAFAVSAAVLIASVMILGIFYDSIWNTILEGLSLM